MDLDPHSNGNVLLAFSRQQVLNGEDVALTTQLNPELGCVRADPAVRGAIREHRW